MSTVLAVLLAGSAAVRAEPSQRVLHRCESSLQTPSGERLVVPGWGPSEDLAQAQSRRVARFLAAQDLAVDLIPGLLSETDEGQARLLDRLAHPLGDTQLGVPGYQLDSGACVLVAAGATDQAHSWVAEWSAGEPEPVARGHAAVAIESARRRACLLTYQSSVEGILRDLSRVSAEERDGTATAGMESVFESLTICLTRAQPQLSTGAEDWNPTQEHLTECTASMMRVEGSWMSVQAWSEMPEWAAEVALWELSLVQTGRGLGEAIGAALRATPELRRMGVSAGAARMTRLAARDVELERASLSCVQLAPDQGQELAWRPVDVEISERCGPLSAWSRRQLLMDPGASWTELRNRSCQQWVQRSLPDGDEIIARAPEGTVETAALGIWEPLIHCEAQCRGDASRTRSPSDRPWVLADQPDAREKRVDQERLRKAIEERDAEQFEICVPAVASFGAVMAAQPERFWGDMERLERSGELYEIFSWEQYRGRWYLMPAE